MNRQVVLDTETTGLSPEKGHRLIEVGCLELVNRKITGNNFHYYVNPERSVDQGAIEVHGLTNAFLADKPLFAEIAEELFQYLEGAELIIHNAPFDLGFLDAEFMRYKKRMAPIKNHCAVIDTLPMAREIHPGQQNTLDALCRRYGIDNAHRELHGALLDAELLAEVYLRMTGGQKQLFVESKSSDEDMRQLVEEQVVLRRDKPTPVLRASSDELIAHQAFLNQLAKKGDCVWEEQGVES